MKTSVLEYTDFRLFLKDFIEEKKKSSYGFSLRFLASKMDCNPGFLHRVLKGERKLSAEYQLKLHKVLKLSKKEKSFFDLLVNFNQAKKPLEKEYYFNELKKYKSSKIYIVSRKQYALYGEWYNVAIRELINVIPVYDTSDSTCKRIASYMSPDVKTSEIKKSLEILIDTGIIEKRVSGRYYLKEKLITTGMEIPVFTVQNILSQFFDLGKAAIERFTRKERVVSTVSLSLSDEGYEQIKLKTEEYRKELLKIAKNDMGKLNRVYHMNLQLFPLTNKIGVEK